MAENEKLIIKTESTPDAGASKITQILLRRKLDTQWDSFTEAIPLGEPCFSYDPINGDYVLKIGAVDENGSPLTWSQLQLLRGRVDDGELG